MNSNHVLRSIGACLFFCSPTVIASERLVPGHWQFAMTTDGATRTMDQCITSEKAAEVNGDSKSGRALAEKNAKGRCSVDAYDVVGDEVSYTLTCGSRMLRSVTIFKGDTSSGSLVTAGDGKSVTTTITAKRVGACP